MILPAPPGNHVRDHGSRDVEHAHDIRVEHRLQLLRSQQTQKVITDDAGIVDQHVDAPAPLDDLAQPPRRMRRGSRTSTCSASIRCPAWRAGFDHLGCGRRCRRERRT